MQTKLFSITGVVVLIVVVFFVALNHSSQNAVPAPVITTERAASSTAPATDTMAMPTTTSNAAPAPTKPATPVTTVPVTPAASKAVSITIKNYAFLPKTITIKKGTTVTWTNSDIAKHTVTSDSGSGPSSSFFGMGESYSYTFTQTGSFPYHCEPHPYMTATIVVTE